MYSVSRSKRRKRYILVHTGTTVRAAQQRRQPLAHISNTLSTVHKKAGKAGKLERLMAKP